MFLHTIVPVEQVFAGMDETEYQYRRAHNSYLQGVCQDGKFTVSRLISTDPRMYLDPRYAPGATLGRPDGS